MKFINANYSKKLMSNRGFLTELTFVKEEDNGITFSMDRYNSKYVKVFVNQTELHKFLSEDNNQCGKLFIVGLVKDKRYEKYPVELPHGTVDAFTISRVALIKEPIDIVITGDFDDCTIV